MSTEPRVCTACRFHHLEAPLGWHGPGLHLCTVREALPDDPADERTPSEREEAEQYFLGWDCDAARRQGARCGPAGALWTPLAAPDHPK